MNRVIGSFIVLISILFTVTVNAQKSGADNHSEINQEKVAYVAKEKVDRLNKAVKLKGKKQKNRVYNIYKNHEVKTQTLFRKEAERETRYYEIRHYQTTRRSRPNTYKNRPSHVQKVEELKKKTDNRILEILDQKQKKRLVEYKKKEKSKMIQ